MTADPVGVTVRSLTHDLIALHETPHEVPPFTQTYPDLAPQDGYQAARGLHDYRLGLGWRRAGRKIGFTNRTIWERYGVHEPMWGFVYDETLVPWEGGSAMVPLHGLQNPRIEPEIAFRLKAAPSLPASPESLVDEIEWVAHSIEIVQCYHPHWQLRLPDCTAANGLHGRLIVGTPQPLQGVPDIIQRLPDVRVVLHRGPEAVDTGVGANVLGSPLLALAHLVHLLAGQPGAPGLQAGEVVTTGVITDAHPVMPGEEWWTEIDGLPLPGLRVSFQ